MSTIDTWSQYSWAWAIPEQREWFKEVEKHYAQAILGGVVPKFMKSLRLQWFLGWPILPELIAQGLLPPEASNDGYEATDEQWAVFQ